jgi:hypothetical protein
MFAANGCLWPTVIRAALRLLPAAEKVLEDNVVLRLRSDTRSWHKICYVKSTMRPVAKAHDHSSSDSPGNWTS